MLASEKSFCQYVGGYDRTRQKFRQCEWASPHRSARIVGATGALKMQDQKMQDWKMTDLKMA